MRRTIKGEAISKSEYSDLANTYDSPPEVWNSSSLGPTAQDKSEASISRPHFPLAPRLIITPEQEELETPRHVLPPEDEAHRLAIQRLRRLLSHDPSVVSTDKAWRYYQALRTPRLRYLDDVTVHKLFRQLAWVEFKSRLENSQRVFTFLEECLGEKVEVTQGEWTTAISFAARWLRTVTSEEVKRAVETWMRMEQYGAQADHVTFNILFDAAVRAGRFALADTIFNELKSRNMPLLRSLRTSVIYYAGIRGDGDAVREAFRDFVNAGEIVNTGTMNCVILSFVRSGEAASAEHVLEKMKRLHERKFGTDGSRDWKSNRQVNILLRNTAIDLRREKDEHESSFFGSPFSADRKREEIQRASPIAPDARTYRILIRYHCYTSGDMDRVQRLLVESKNRNFHVHGSVYVHVFRGFGLHGGHAYSAWSRRALEHFWTEFLTATEIPSVSASQRSQSVDSAKSGSRDGMEDLQSDIDFAGELSEEDRAPYLTRPAAFAVLKAFYKCAGKKRMLDVWNEIQRRWEDMRPDEDRVPLVRLVENLCLEDGVYVS